MAAAAEPSRAAGSAEAGAGERLRPQLPTYGAAGGPAAAEGGESPPRTVRRTPSLRNLPDLSQRLIEAGIYGEYVNFRRRYQQWRRGEAKGAAGELTVNALQLTNDPTQFEYWYPTASIFQWRYTMAYWKAIMFVMGSLLFTFDGAVCYFQPPGGGTLVKIGPNAIGSVLFSVATYIGYLHLINIATPEKDSITYALPDCAGMIEKGTQVSSIVGTVAFFVGAVLFNVGTFAEVVEAHMSPICRFTLVSLMNVVASCLFVLGGLCECIHNGLFFGGSTWRDFVWWAAILDTIGGVNFLLACAPHMLWPDDGEALRPWVQMNYMIGSGCFIVSSAMLVLMWRANNFGMTLLRQLNLAVKTKGFINLTGSTTNEEHVGVRVPISDEAGDGAEAAPAEEQLSLRGALYIILYCWFMFVAMANCMFREQRFSKRHAADWMWMDMMMDLCMQLFVVVIISLVLVMHSVVTEVPDEQPYYCAVMCTRAVFFIGACAETFWFVKFWSTPPYKIVSVT